MKEENVVYVTLNKLKIKDRSVDASVQLSKEVDRKYLDGTFRELIAYMLDSEADELNVGYDPDEKDIVDSIEGFMKQLSKPLEERSDALVFCVNTKTSGMTELNKDGELSELEKQISSYEQDEIILNEETDEGKSFPRLPLGWMTWPITATYKFETC